MKTPLLNLFIYLAAMTGTAMADTFFMKDGTELSGKIISQDSTHYVIEVQVTKSIKDERKIERANVLRVETEKLDLKAFEEIAKIKPIPNLMSADDYATRITQVKKFIADYPGSSKRKDAKDLLAELKAEANEILAGGIKMDGKIIPPTEYRANAYEIDARIKATSIRALAMSGQTLQALRAFSEFERDFQNTEPYKELLPFITQVIQSYLADVGQMDSNFEKLTKDRQTGLDRMSGEDRTNTERAIKEESALLEKKLKMEKDSAIGWVTVHPFCKPALEDALSFGRQEISRINASKSETPVDAGKLFRDTLVLIKGTADASAVSTALSAATSAKMPPRYLDILTAAASAKGIKP